MSEAKEKKVESKEEKKEEKEFFSGIKPIRYDPKAETKDCLVFKQYNADEVILGKTMKEWLRFAVCFWHTFTGDGHDPFGKATIKRPWDDGTDSLENAKTRLRAAFEFMSKLGVPYWTFHDRDIAPEGKTLEETNANLDEIVKLAKQLQAKTGIKCLWGTANLFGHPRYMNGASTNPDMHVFAYAAAQIRKAIEVTHELGGENYVFWGGREGYQTLLNTDVKRELDHMAKFMKMALAYKAKIGFKGQFLIEPKPKEPTAHQYDYDAQTVMGFLLANKLDKDFKLNIEPNHTTLAGHNYQHDVEIASRFGMLGSIDANTGDSSLGWDTDQFPTDVRNAVHVMRAVLAQGGLAPGGLNFDAKVRRESTDPEDLFFGHICAMDTFAKALRVAAKIQQEGVLPKMLSSRYESWDSTLGHKVESGAATLEECEDYIKHHGEPAKTSAKQEKFEAVLNHYL